MLRSDNPPAVLFDFRKSEPNVPGLLTFCVMSQNWYPVLVHFNGFYSDARAWACKKCKKDCSNECPHIAAAEATRLHERYFGMQSQGVQDAVAENREQLLLHLNAQQQHGSFFVVS